MTKNKKTNDWPKDLKKIRDEYIGKLYHSDLFDRKTIQGLIKDRFGKTISIVTIDRVIKNL